MAGVVLLSLKVAAACVAIALPPGLAMGWLLARRRFPGRTVVDAVVHLPLVLPPVVTGYGLLLLFAPAGPLGFLDVAFSWEAAAVASAVVSFPLLVRAVRLGFEAVDPALEEAAMVLGASPVRAFLTITLPLAAPGVLAGAILAFGRSLGEFGATITFAGNVPGETTTLPLAVYTALQVPGGEALATRLALVSTALAFATMLAGEALARRTRWRG
ncbi:MAG: molybdate ABC transporter permease subunit [Myxococcota bacterium]